MSLAVYLLIDRSGSMANKWDETISSVNAYINDLKKQKVRCKATVCCFDSQGGLTFDVLRDAVAMSKWKDIGADEIAPRGYTPLYDAVGKLISKADADGPKKAAIVIMTDGGENASKEISKDSARAMIKRCQDKEWQVVFLGADFDAYNDAGNLGVLRGSTMNMSAGNYGAAAQSLSYSTKAYFSSGRMMSFSDEDRKLSGENKVGSKTTA